MEPRGEGRRGTQEVKLRLSLAERQATSIVAGRLPLLRRPRARALRRHRSRATCSCATCRCSACTLARTARRAWSPRCSTCSSPTTASTAASAASTSPRRYDDDAPYTPAWAEKITGVPRDQIITVAREFADNAEKTNGQSMVIIGAAMNHWYHMRHELPRHHQHAGDVRLHRPVAAAAGRTMSARKSCGRRPAGRRSPSRSTGSARRAR